MQGSTRWKFFPVSARAVVHEHASIDAHHKITRSGSSGRSRNVHFFVHSLNQLALQSCEESTLMLASQSRTKYTEELTRSRRCQVADREYNAMLIV